ncbi:MAG: FecR domain-containing protein [Vicinamibacterales bacterium]|jgi:ferric-dicitrate binding protein FerR (iron transport regulator)|nr:FecR domain-containing protein [Vicinamibacterales bacterium]
MSEDRLEQALQEMKQEDVDAATVDAARARVWNKVAGAAGCAEFRADFRAYLGGELADSRRVLIEDHLSRCPACRTAMAGQKGERRVIAMPQRSSSRWMRWGSLAAAAVLVLSVLYLSRDAIDAMMAPGGPRATVVSADGGLYRLPGGALKAGAAISEKEVVRTGPGAHAVLRLADGSMIDVNERTELFVTAAWSGRAIHLQRGDIIVSAAKQRRGHLQVLTRDSIASVKGTVFAVSAGMGGSVVSVVEGSVAVNQPGRDVVLSPGEQATSNPALASSVEDAVAWSPEAADYLELLASFVKIERQLADMNPAELRTSSTLLSYLPAGAFVYGAVPNLGGRIGQALALADEQSSENAAFSAWWNSETGRQLRQMVDRVQSVSSLLGDEVAFSVGMQAPGQEAPMVIARVQPGRRAALASTLDGLFAETGEPTLPYSVTDDLMVVSNSAENLAWALGHLGQGAGSPFAAAIKERYQRGVGWLVGIDAAPVVAMAKGDDAPPVELAGMVGLKYLFLEQRAPAGAEENEITFVFPGERKGMASWLADSGSGGAAEYLPADALVAGYVSTREPWQLFQELSALMTKENETLTGGLAEANDKLGAGFLENLTAAVGTESAFALHGFSVNGPTWTMAVLANDSSVIDNSLRKLADAFNAELSAEEQVHRIAIGQEIAGGRTWTTMKAGGVPFGVTWTYDQGYLVAASDRGSAERAIATRNGGSPLVWSPAFLAQLPSSAGMHPSAFAWLNTKGALGIFTALAPNPALTKLLGEREAVLVVVDGKADQIRAASRTRLTGLIMDVMLLEGVSRTP